MAWMCRCYVLCICLVDEGVKNRVIYVLASLCISLCTMQTSVIPAASVPCGLVLPNENRPEFITIRRKELERCVRAAIERGFGGGLIGLLTDECMTELDKSAVEDCIV